MKYLLIFLLSIIISGAHSGVASTPAYKVKPVENHIAVASKRVAAVTMSVQYHATAPVYVSPVPKPVVTPILVQPTIPKTPVSDTPQNTNSAKCYTNCADPNRPYFDQWGNEFDYMGNLIQVGNCTIQQPPINGPNPYCNQTNSSCAPTAAVQDPCKLGQCFGYPYGICESNPNQGEMTK